jgi:hypothetical protein
MRERYLQFATAALEMDELSPFTNVPKMRLGNFSYPVRNAAPPSEYIPLGRRCAFFRPGCLGSFAAGTPLLVLFTESLDVGFAIRIEEVLTALLPRCLEFGRCDVPVRPAFTGNGT